MGQEALCLLWMGIDREFPGLIFGAGDAIPGLASYMVIGLLFLASARFALLGQRRLALAFFFLPIALFIIVLQLGSK